MQNNPFIGVWQLVSGEFGEEGEPVMPYDMQRLKARKVISAEGFSFLTLQDDAFYSASSGQYRFDGTHYTEVPAMASYSMPEGREYVFRYAFVDGLWHNKRTENGVQVEHEIWQRVAA
ncbi:hypothetical protein ACTSKR_10115 [Chitinibacteraceae bacterium HSL-7]